MNEAQLKAIINDLVKQPKESEWVEFKLNIHSENEIGERISALSNGAAVHNQEYGYLVFGIEDRNAAIASRIIKDTYESGMIKDEDPENKSRKHRSYVPFWA